MKRSLAILALALTGCVAAACQQKQAQAPDARNVCYQVVAQKDGTSKYNEIARGKTSLEACAAELDTVRYRFMGLGSPRTQITGFYNGTYMFIDSGGMSTAQSLDGGRFVAFGRTDDGRLTIPGYIPQPGPRGQGVTITQNPADQQRLRNVGPIPEGGKKQ